MQRLHNTVSATHKRRQGFTLIELIIAISIMLVVLGGGLAGYLSLNDRQTLIGAGKELQQYMRTAQKKARVGDKPTGCTKLEAYALVANASAPVTVELQAVCENNTYSVDSFPLANTVSLSGALNMQFIVLHGGVTNAQTVVLQKGTKTYSFTVNTGGEISEGTFGSTQ